jgi:Glycogen recognition site of AMP-activated protein kinase
MPATMPMSLQSIPSRSNPSQDNAGVWHGIAVLRSGRHAYRFLVDGEWHNDLAQPHRVANGFGTFNNVMEISKPGMGSQGKSLSANGV